MKESQLLKLDQAVQVLCDAADASSSAVISYIKDGRWQIAKSVLHEVVDTGLIIELTSGREAEAFPVNQPVGISLRHEHIKYIFETHVTAANQDVSDGDIKRYTVALPNRIEMLKRRAYNRVSPPRTMNVNVTFWHRGYNDCQADEPSENYWQGSLVDLSAGGLLMSVKDDAGECFRQDQYLGLQFTPMFYQKPIMLEGKINRLGECDETGKVNIALEFLGLEASGEGREKIHRLVSIVNTYAMQNKGMGTIVAAEAASAADVEVESMVHEQAAEFSEQP